MSPIYLYDAIEVNVVDSERQMMQSVVSGVTANYVYDGDGKRVKKGAGKIYWFGMGADPLEESNGSVTAGNLTANRKRFGSVSRVPKCPFKLFLWVWLHARARSMDLGSTANYCDHEPLSPTWAAPETWPHRGVRYARAKATERFAGPNSTKRLIADRRVEWRYGDPHFESCMSLARTGFSTTRGNSSASRNLAANSYGSAFR